MQTKPFKILSLNGGGIRALLQAHYLELISKDLGNFWQDFDLIAGTSAGAIVAAGLWSGRKTPGEIALLFEEVGSKVFPSAFWLGLLGPGRWPPSLLWVPAKTGLLRRRARLRARLFQALLTEAYGAETALGAKRQPLIAITATEIAESKVRVFCPLSLEEDAELKLIDAVMASAALPGVFPEHEIRDRGEDRCFADGGLWANAPMLGAVALAAQIRRDFDAIRVVSLGTAAWPHQITVKEYRSLVPLSRSFYGQLSEIASSGADELAREAVQRLVTEQNFLHIDALPDERITAWNVDSARKKLPDLAKRLAGDNQLTKRLRSLVQ